jgi:putative nucleotide binding protein
MWQILEERRGEPFKSFDDLKDRVKLMPDPEKIILKRILKELEREEKHYVFLD